MGELDKKPSFKLTIGFWVAVICVVFVFFVAITIPKNIKIATLSPAEVCINNLRQIDAAANEFAQEHHLTNGDAINYPSDLTPYIYLKKDGKIPPCLQGGVYSIKKVGDVPTCSLGTNVTPPHVLP